MILNRTSQLPCLIMEVAAMNMEPSVAVVDDDPIVRESLAEIISDMRLHVECYASARGFLDAHDMSRPGCVVLDVWMPGMSGAELQERMVSDGIRLPVVVITGRAHVPMIVHAMKLGAIDFLEKPFRPQQLQEAIRTAIECDVDRHQAQAIREAAEARIVLLTPAERAVLKGIAAGKANKAIAEELGISLRTVQFRRASIMKKTKLDYRAQLVELAQDMAPATHRVAM